MPYAWWEFGPDHNDAGSASIPHYEDGEFICHLENMPFEGAPFMNKLKDPTFKGVWRPELLLTNKNHTCSQCSDCISPGQEVFETEHT